MTITMEMGQYGKILTKKEVIRMDQIYLETTMPCNKLNTS